MTRAIHIWRAAWSAFWWYVHDTLEHFHEWLAKRITQLEKETRS